MKKLYDAKGNLLIGVFVLTITLGYSQNYDFTASAGTFVPVTGGTNLSSIQGDDLLSPAIPIGFTFNYFGNNFTELRVSSNGVLTFDLAASPYLQFNLIAGSRSNTIAPLWDDLNGDAGTATYVTGGIAPNRVFTMEWLNWKWPYQSSISMSFQVKLYETSNRIEFIYRRESGALEWPSASIGIIGPNANHFYSLANAGTSPSLDASGFDAIDSKPETGQTYSFSPSAATIVAPATQASNIVVSNDLGASVTVGWTNGGGANRLVLMKKTTSTSELFTPLDNNFYAASNHFYNYGSNWMCVYNGSGNTITVDGLEPGQTYRIQVIEYNGLGGNQKYLNGGATNNPVNVTTMVTVPESPYSELQMTRVSGTQASITMVEGNGSYRAVFVKEGTGTPPILVNQTTYIANTTVGAGTQVGSSGWYCVYNGATFTGPVTLYGLSLNTTYTIFISDYYGTPGSEHYNITPDQGNTRSFTTLPTVQVPTYQFTATTTMFTPLATGTPVDEVEDDEGIKIGIPIGFTFYFAGNPVSTLKASSNGLLSFNPYYDGLINGSPDYGANDLDNNENARPLLAPLWDDLTGYYGTSSYLTTGVSPNRVFTIEFLNWSWDWMATSGISFQVKLYETSNKIEYVYRQESGALTYPSASIGLAFANRGTGNFVSLNNSSASPTASTTVETTTIATKPATGQVYSFTPQLIPQTITFAPLATKTFGDNPFMLDATVSSGLMVEYTSSNPSVASVSGGTVTIHSAGTTDITAAQPGNPAYSAATPVTQTLTVNKAAQVISCPTVPQKMFGQPTFTLGASTTSGLPLSFQSDNPGVVSVTNNTVTIQGVGNANITISQAGDANYNAAPDFVLPITVIKGDQIITFTIENRTFGDIPFALNASSNSGLPIAYSTTSTKVALTGNMVTINAAGSVTIQASQAGDANYNAAAPVERTFCINPAKPVITLSTSEDGLTLSSSASSGNQWSRNGTALNGATSQSYIVDGPGEYKVTTSTVDGCQSTPSDGKTIVITDVEDTASGISVVPNPVTADFTIQGITDNATVLLYDQTGRQIQAKEGSGEITMSLRAHPAAMYFLKIQTTRGLVFKKIIKK